MSSCGDITWEPLPQYTLYPLSSLGLWDAVTITPVAAPYRMVAKDTKGVGHTDENKYTGMDDDIKTLAVSSANLKKKI